MQLIMYISVTIIMHGGNTLSLLDELHYACTQI